MSCELCILVPYDRREAFQGSPRLLNHQCPTKRNLTLKNAVDTPELCAARALASAGDDDGLDRMLLDVAEHGAEHVCTRRH